MSRKIVDRYLKHPACKELISQAKKLGFKVEVTASTKRLGGATGRFYVKPNLIKLALRYGSGGLISQSFFIHNLAHEVRHAIHYVTGLYNNYYESLEKGVIPNIGVGKRAETDCHNWAGRYVEQLGIKLKLAVGYTIDDYPTEEICGYMAYCKRLRKNLKKNGR